MDNRLNVSVTRFKVIYDDVRRDALYEKMVSHFRVTDVSFEEKEMVGCFDLYSLNFDVVALKLEDFQLGLNVSLLAPIHEWQPSYYFTLDPQLMWKNSDTLVEIDIQSASCFLLLMFLSAATVYLSTRCLRRRIPRTTGFWTILWDFVASFFFEPFPSDAGVLSIRLVLASWLLGITIFCNEVNGVFKGKLSVKEYAGVETEEDLDALGYKFIQDIKRMLKVYVSYKRGEELAMVVTSFEYAKLIEKNLYISKKSAAERLGTQLVWMGKVESRLFEYDARIHDIVMNWDLRLYEGSTGKRDDREELRYRMKSPFNQGPQLFTPYEMADLSIPFRLYGYGLAAACAVKFLETILAIYNNRKAKRKRKFPKPFH